MGLLGIDSTSTTSQAFDNRQGATDQGINNRQGGAVGNNPIAISADVGSNALGPNALQAQNSNVARDGGILLQGSSKLDFSSSTDSSNRSVNTFTDNSNRSTNTNYTSDPLVVSRALDSYDKQAALNAITLKDLFQQGASKEKELVNQFSGVVNSQAEAQQGLIDKFLSAVSGLATNSQTGGDAERNKIVLYISLGLLAVVALFFWRQR